MEENNMFKTAITREIIEYLQAYEKLYGIGKVESIRHVSDSERDVEYVFCIEDRCGKKLHVGIPSIENTKIDLPACGFKDCRKCFDGNCRSTEDYRSCDYAIKKSQLNAYQSDDQAIASERLRILDLMKNMKVIQIKENDGEYIDRNQVVLAVTHSPETDGLAEEEK